MAKRAPRYTMPRRAVFLDRDGTLIHDTHYIDKPERVTLIPGASTAVRYLNNALVPVIVATNQAGIARGLFTEEDYERVRERLDDLLGERDAFIDATYHCPHHPEFTGPCDCRKPKTGMYEQAIREMNLLPPQCTYIGDRLHDIVAAKTLGGRGILVPTAETPAEEIEQAKREFELAPNLAAAVAAIIGTPITGAID
ncbi:MAG TPA: HAD family hydrolase [Gemmatimonadaceae bacterium]|nr:HAD family hydrolase [Gemmatimonadaceae bacterium]